jgi:hypothetical protein
MTSIVLLIIACGLVRRFPGATKGGVDATGILSSMWIAYRCPELQDTFLQVVEPSTDNLRKMGMFEVQLARGWPSYSLPLVPSSGHEELVDDM